MQIHYPRNHFVNYVENGDPTHVKGVFAYGTHYWICTIKGVKIIHIKNLPMWCEVVHEKNILNDAYFRKAKMVKEEDKLKRDFSINELVNFGFGIYAFRFLPRYLKTFVKRTRKYIKRQFRRR